MGKRHGADSAGGDARFPSGMGREAATNEKGRIRSCVCSPRCYSSIIWQLSSERKQKQHKDKEEERSRLRRKKQKNHAAGWHLGSAWGSSTGWEVAVFSHGENWIPLVHGAVQVPGVH